MKRLPGYFLIILLHLYSLAGNTQQYPTDEKEITDNIVYSNTFQSETKITSELKNPNHRVRFQDPQTPRFQLHDSGGKFTLGIGGRVRTAIDYDFHGFIDSPDFYPSLISIPGTGNYSRNNFQVDATASSIYVKLLGHTTGLGDFVVYVNGYFRGSGSTLKMHNAYLSFLGFTLGWDYGLFTDAAGSPPTIDYEGPAGQVLYRTGLIHYTHTFSSRWSAGTGMEIPSVNAATNDYLNVNTQRAPNIPAFIQYNWNKNSHLRLAGVIRPMTYSSDMYGKAHSQTGWGTQLSTVFSMFRKWKTFGQVTYGEGIGHFFNDLSTMTLDLVPDRDEGKMQVLPMLGWYAGLQYNFTPSVFLSSTYSQSRIYGKNGYPQLIEGFTYRYGQYLVGNLFWNVNSNLMGGIEYLRGWKTGFDDITYHANRLSLLVQYSF